MSVAFRVALLQALCIPTDEPDPDSAAYERSPATPQVDEQRRQTILANARREIGAADSREGLDEIRSRIGRAVDHGVITEQDAVELRRLWVRRLDELFPQAQPALDETQETQP
jgi:hypothetical protein